MESHIVSKCREPWNKSKLVGQKAPLKLKEIWAIRIRLELSHRIRDLALFNLAIDSKLRACDLVKLKVRDISHGNQITARAIVMQQKLACLCILKLPSQHVILFMRGLSTHGLDLKTFFSLAVFMTHRIYLPGNMHVLLMHG